MALLQVEADQNGIIDLGESGIEALALTLNADPESIRPHLERLAARGSIVIEPDHILIPNFQSAQNAKWNNSTRCRVYREKKRKGTDTPRVRTDTRDVGGDTPDVECNIPRVVSKRRNTPRVRTDTRDVVSDTGDVTSDTPRVVSKRVDTQNVATDQGGVKRGLSNEEKRVARNKVIQEGLEQIRMERANSGTGADTPDVSTDTPDVEANTPDVSTDTPRVRSNTRRVNSS